MLNWYEIYLKTTNSDFHYARFHILAVHLHFGLFWSSGIPTVLSITYSIYTCTQGPIILRGGRMCKYDLILTRSLKKKKKRECVSYGIRTPM